MPASGHVHRRARGDRAQTLPLLVLLLFGMLGMCALAVDVGSWYQQKLRSRREHRAGELWGTSRGSRASGRFGQTRQDDDAHRPATPDSPPRWRKCSGDDWAEPAPGP